MKNLSIKSKIIIWYTGVVALILGIVFILLLITIGSYSNLNIKSTLKEEVIECSEEINRKGFSVLSSADFEYYDDGVNIVIFNNSKIIGGKPPSNNSKIMDFNYNNIQKQSINEDNWYIYDYKTNIKNITVRGYYSFSSTQLLIVHIFKVFIFLIPFLIILSGIICYFIVKKEFKPIDSIINTINNINNGNDLSKRVVIDTNNKNEVYMISSTFNDMLMRIESSFEKEKQFTVDASHELRTPISVILASCDYALHTGTKKEYKEYLLLIQKQTTKLSNLVNELLILNRLDRDKIKLNKENINLYFLLEGIIEELNIKAKEKNINIICDVEKNIYINVDESLIIRVFINLISNAIKYSNSNSNSYIKISCTEDESTTNIMVEDNGIGIKEENIDKIWDKFYQENSARDNEGLGLGLSIVKWIILKHGATIKVDSKKDKGTKFTIILNK